MQLLVFPHFRISALPHYRTPALPHSRTLALEPRRKAVSTIFAHDSHQSNVSSFPLWVSFDLCLVVEAQQMPYCRIAVLHD